MKKSSVNFSFWIFIVQNLPFLASASASPIELFGLDSDRNRQFQESRCQFRFAMPGQLFLWFIIVFYQKVSPFWEAAPHGAVLPMSQRQHVTEWTTYDHLCFSAKVQCLVDEATCCNLEIFISRLAEMGSALSTYSRARLYIIQWPYARTVARWA